MKTCRAPSTVLVVDDDPAIVEYLTMALELKGIKTYAAYDAFTALYICKQNRPDLVILDLHLGYNVIQGAEVLWNIKRNPETASTVVLIFTGSRDPEVERLCRDEIGADSYLLKSSTPTKDLVKIVRLWLRRLRVANAKEIELGNLRINLAESQAHLDTKPLSLTPQEYNMLAYAARKRSKVVSWDRFVQRFWNFPNRGLGGQFSEPVEFCLIHLRSKLGAAGHHLTSVPGAGLMWAA